MAENMHWAFLIWRFLKAGIAAENKGKNTHTLYKFLAMCYVLIFLNGFLGGLRPKKSFERKSARFFVEICDLIVLEAHKSPRWVLAHKIGLKIVVSFWLIHQ